MMSLQYLSCVCFLDSSAREHWRAVFSPSSTLELHSFLTFSQAHHASSLNCELEDSKNGHLHAFDVYWQKHGGLCAFYFNDDDWTPFCPF